MTPSQDRPAFAFPRWLPLVVLVALGLGLRFWVIARTEVAARDSIGFIRYALRFENESWIEVIRTSEQPPGYALMVLLVSWPVRAWTGSTSCDTMTFAAQLASAILGALSIIPIVRLGREICDRRIGWLAAGLFLALPSWIRLTSDGLSEATFLFWVSMSLWLGVRALRVPTCGRLFLCGLTAGAAFLTRPEGLELAVAIGVCLIALQFVANYRQPWLRVPVQSMALAAGLLLFVGPYVAITGKISNKNTAKVLFGDSDADTSRMMPYGAAPSAPAETLLAVWMNETGERGGNRWLWALTALFRETAQGFQYVGLGLAILGVIVWRTRPDARGGVWLLAGLVALHVAILCRMASLSGYLSERHTLMLIVAGCVPAAAALLWLGNRLRPHYALALAATVVAVMIVAELPVLGKPLHANRAGHKAAGRWLAAEMTADDEVMDPFNWAEFYARGPRLAVDEQQIPKRLFVVLEGSDNQHSRLPGIRNAKRYSEYGREVFRWPERDQRGKTPVIVYETRGDLFER